MLTISLVYFNLALGAVAALAVMILRIAALAEICDAGPERAHAAGITVATGFAAIGAGGVILIGAGLFVLPDAPYAALMLALGLAALCLGLGFTHAVGTLRAVLAPPFVPDQPAPEPVAAAPAQ
ncbi:hypothetical protein [uncultured Tateyamaria sp.]|uniref:hypothetical protein n=1 Tax=uncultured Tateyamaria sp. TaxID=455651 RepID=UPI00261C7DD5|nr:hypothetical protein [uncultured Tateyamaria sp.]